MKIFLLFISGFAVAALAQDVAPIVTPEPALFAVSQTLSKLGTFLAENAYVSVGAGVVAEVVMRLIPTKRPVSIILGLRLIFKAAASLFTGLDFLAGKLVPQNLK